MLWPADWRDAGALDLLQGTPIGVLVFPSGGGYANIIERARQRAIAICDLTHPPSGVAVVKGEWPGIRLTPGQGDASSGPTGAPWIDSNGWLIRLTRESKPGVTAWVTAEPPKANEIVPLTRHLVAVADGAAHGGCWAVTLDKTLADGLAARKPAAVDGWKKLMGAIAFFQAHSEWSAWPAAAVLSVVSSFAGDNEFFSHELLNLMARTNVSYGIVETTRFRPEALRGLRAALYPDSQPPPAAVRQALLDFAERGGLLIAGPGLGAVSGAEPVRSGADEPNPRYGTRRYGKGRISMAYKQPDDPYEMAQDVQILVSHRYDLVRFFNGFLLGAYSTVSSGGQRRMTHIINYAGGADAEDPATARIAGHFRSAKLWSFDRAEARRLEMVTQKDAVEVPLPGVAVYGGIELEAYA